MKKYHEVGNVRQDGQVIGFFIKEGGIMDNSYPFFVPYDQFVELVKQCEIQQLYWDRNLNDIGVDSEDDYGQEDMPRRAKRAVNKAPVAEDFDTFLQRDVIFNCDGSNGLIPIAIVSVIQILFAKSVSIVIPMSETVKEMRDRLCKVRSDLKPLIQEKIGMLNITIPTNICEKLFEDIYSLGYNLSCCTESARNALEAGFLNNSLPALMKLAPETALREVESMALDVTHRSYNRVGQGADSSRAYGVDAFTSH